MLPSGRFPRFLLVFAALIALSFVFDLLFVRSSPVNLLACNCLDFLMVALAAVASFYRARRSTGDPRQAWTLLAIALILQSTAQAMTTYYQSFLPSAAHSPWPSDVLFFVWPAPIFLMLFPASEDTPSRINWIRILDFLQIAIVAVTIYLYFFFSPSRWIFEQSALLRQMLVLYMVRDSLFALGFALRARASLPRWLRNFYFVLASVFVALILSDLTDFLLAYIPFTSPTFSDILWASPYAIVVYFAASWKQPAAPEQSVAAAQLPVPVSAQFLPGIMPLLVIFMSYAIAREHFLLAWLAVSASVVSSGIRLILANQQQRQISANLLDTEKALRRTEQTLSIAFRASPDSFSINAFPDGPYLEINDGFTSMTGYTREDAIGKTHRNLNLWLEHSHRDETLAHLTQSGSVRDVEFRFRKKSGEIRFGNMSASLIDYQGAPASLIMVRDVTVHREAEEILRSSEERFRSLLHNVHVGILTYDPQGRIVYANRAVLDILGLPLGEIAGKTFLDMKRVPICEDGTPIPRDLLPVSRAIATKLPQVNQLLGWLAPGRSEPLWTLVDAVPELASTGEISRVLVSFTNLTEQRRAAAALRESEERFRTLVRDLHLGVVLHSPDGRIEFVNPAARNMLGLSEAEMLGKTGPQLDLFGVDEDGKAIPGPDHPVDTVLRTLKPVHSRVIGLPRPHDPQNKLWLFGNSVPQFDANGKLLCVISAFSDISEMKNAERAIHSLSSHLLKLQDEERRRLGRELHDGLAQTVLAINLSLAQARQSIKPHDEVAIRALDKARHLTQQISREIRTLSYLLHPPLLDDLGLVSALKEYAQGFSERSGIDTQLFVLSSFDRLPQPVETALFRIVQESLTNVQRHSGSATAKIRLRLENSLVTLEVIDFGQGMPAPNGDSHSRESRFGVGIPGMRERMTLLGGSLEIISHDKGTTVRAIIPIVVLSPGLSPPKI